MSQLDDKKFLMTSLVDVSAFDGLWLTIDLQQRRVIDASEGLEAMHGRSLEDIKQLPLDQLAFNHDEALLEIIVQQLSAGKKSRYIITHWLKHKSEVPVPALTMFRLGEAPNTLNLLSFRLQQHELPGVGRQPQALSYASQVFGSDEWFPGEQMRAQYYSQMLELLLQGDLTVLDFIQSVVGDGVKHMNINGFAVMRVDAIGQRLEPFYAPTLAAGIKKYLYCKGSPISTDSPCWCGRAVYFKKAIFENNIVQYIDRMGLTADIKQLFLEAGYAAAGAWPVVGANGQVWGALLIYFSEERTPTKDEQAWMMLMVNLIQLRLQQEEKQKQIDAQKALERKHQDQLERINKMEFLSQMAIGLAHQLNQPLTVIASTASLLSMKHSTECIASCTTTSRVKALSQSIQDQALVMGELVHKVRELYQRGDVILTRVDVNTFMTRVIDQIKTCAGFDLINIEYAVSDALNWTVDVILMEQVVINLVQNAKDALENTAVPKISIRAFVENSHSILEVEDNGEGIPSEMQSEIFEHFFTTRPRGSGIGLSLVRAAIDAHGGMVSVQSTAKRTVFKIQLPVVGPVDNEQHQVNNIEAAV